MNGYLVNIFDHENKNITIDFDYRPVFISRPKAIAYATDKMKLFGALRYTLDKVHITGLQDTPEFQLANAVMELVENRQK